jgi:hypothetical protein
MIGPNVWGMLQMTLGDGGQGAVCFGKACAKRQSGMALAYCNFRVSCLAYLLKVFTKDTTEMVFGLHPLRQG